MADTMGPWVRSLALVGLLGLISTGQQVSDKVIGVAADGRLVLAAGYIQGSHGDGPDDSRPHVAVSDRFPYIESCNNSRSCDYQNADCACRWGLVHFSSLLYPRAQEQGQAAAARRLVDFYWSYSAQLPRPAVGVTGNAVPGDFCLKGTPENAIKEPARGKKTQEKQRSPDISLDKKPTEKEDKPSTKGPSSKKKKKTGDKKSKKEKKSGNKKSKKDKLSKGKDSQGTFGGMPILRPDQLMAELGKLGVLKKP